MNVGNVSRRIKKIMQETDISVDDLEKRTGLNRDFLDMIWEEKEISPALGPLLKISRSLGVRLGTLLDDQISVDPLIVRNNEREQNLHETHPDKGKPDVLTFYALGRGKTDRHMEPFFIEIYPQPARDIQLSSHEGEEFIVVTSGEIEVTYGRETHRLQPGDSIYYNSIVPHYVRCVSETRATIYAVLYVPE
jgi:mannose-6-phosphate isomerase-like protein (cupin superfamily)/DNA-binding Xre family transcriptional regulator